MDQAPGPNERYSSPYPDNLFDWMRVLFVAGARKELNAREVAIAGFVALSGDSTTGQNCYLHEARLVEEFEIHRSTLHRSFTKLRDQGWFVQTRKPTYAGKRPGQAKGRAAQYRIAWPRLELRHDLPQAPVARTHSDQRHDSADSRVAAPEVGPRHDGADAAQVVSHPDLSRVAIPVESCRTTTADEESLPTCDPPTCDPPTRGWPVQISTTVQTPDHEVRIDRAVRDDDQAVGQ